MRVLRVDMFGAAPGRGSTLDVLIPEGRCDDAVVAKAAEYARAGASDETALVSDYSRAGKTFASRIFNAEGETPFGTHSLAGVAACLVGAGLLAPGEVGRTAEVGCQWLWTDGDEVRVPFDGPVVREEIPYDPALFGWGTGTPHAGGVGRAFNFVQVTEDPLSLPVPDLERMRELGLTDLTAFRWDPDAREVLARVFAPGFGIPEDAGCLPAAAALGLTGLGLAGDDDAPVTVRQVTGQGSESVFACAGSINGDTASVRITGQVWLPPLEDDQKVSEA
ncbi:putative PhzF superfamily epimerase YddE/YHI9 [Nocardia tenerifensis]|uniref:Putative PhzF superfamily epimerase YddE/YHI9 n=1 Tax=Nocardia tenerifensis TaxID=228006 RepID=A0A318JPQ9_9NOCA|nr:phenazine biosynthesis protein PhzF [Nocardia tenerifensis]PXX54761.1 putative PhzF superfamily epimerase YddE/YHI9 [Nocardia tenerifensis]